MRRIERVYCEILHKYIHKKISRFTQRQLSIECEVSIGTVNYALSPLQQMGVIEKKQRSFSLLNPKKLLLYWASIRNLRNDIVYSTYAPNGVREIEHLMPSCIFTAYTAYRLVFEVAPADYGEVYAYADEKLVETRFPPNHSRPDNIFILKKDKYIEKRSKNGIAPVQLVYVDLWNLNTWYANEFLKDFDTKLEV